MITLTELKNYIDNNTPLDITYSKDSVNASGKVIRTHYLKDLNIDTFTIEQLKESLIELNKLDRNFYNNHLFSALLYHLEKKIGDEFMDFVVKHDFINTRKTA